MRIEMLKKFFMGCCLFLGYTLFGVAWKLGDIYIQVLNYGDQDLATMTAVLNTTKLLVNFGLGFVVAKLAAGKLFHYTAQGFALGVALAGIGMFGMTHMSGNLGLMVMRGITGAGGAFILLCQSPVTASVFSGKGLKLMNGFNSSAYNIGITTCISAAACLSRYSVESIKVITIIMLLLSAAMVLLILSLGKTLKVDENNNFDEMSEVSDDFSVWDSLKNRFNLSFCLVISGAIVFYTLSFTFADPANIITLLYAGIVGNIIGIVFAGKYDVFKVSRLFSILAGISGVLLIIFKVQLASIALGFSIFCTLPSYITMAYLQKEATPKTLTQTFMILWVGSDLLVTLMVKVFAVVNTASAHAGNLMLLGLILFFSVGTVAISKIYLPKEDLVVEIS